MSHPTDVGLQRKKQQQRIHVQIQEPPPDTDVTPTPSSELDHLTKTKRCWDQIIWITSAPARNLSMDKIWERRETQQFFEDAVSHDDLLMQRVSVVVSMMAIGTGCDATETLWMGGVAAAAAAAAAFAASKDQSTTPQPQQQPPLFIQDEPMMIAIETTGATTPTTNRDNNAASDVAIGTSSAAATTTTELAKYRPQRRQKGHERHRLFHHALVSTFFFHPPETSSLRFCARLVWKKCLVAQRIQYPGCSPLLLATTKQQQHQQLDQLKQSSRKRKLGKCV